MTDSPVEAHLSPNNTFEIAFSNWGSTLGKTGIAPFKSMLEVLPTDPGETCGAIDRILTHLISVGHQEVHISQLASTVEAACAPETVSTLRQSPSCYIRVVQALLLIAHHFTDVEALTGSATPFYISIIQENKMLATVEKLLAEKPNLARGQWYGYITNELTGRVWKTVEDLYDIQSIDTPDLANILASVYPAMLAEHMENNELAQASLPTTLI